MGVWVLDEAKKLPRLRRGANLCPKEGGEMTSGLPFFLFLEDIYVTLRLQQFDSKVKPSLYG